MPGIIYHYLIGSRKSPIDEVLHARQRSKSKAVRSLSSLYKMKERRGLGLRSAEDFLTWRISLYLLQRWFVSRWSCCLAWWWWAALSQRHSNLAQNWLQLVRGYYILTYHGFRNTSTYVFYRIRSISTTVLTLTEPVPRLDKGGGRSQWCWVSHSVEKLNLLLVSFSYLILNSFRLKPRLIIVALVYWNS